MFRRGEQVSDNPVLGLISGVFGIAVGIFFVMPTFGLFGVLWTLFAIVLTGYNAYRVFYVPPRADAEEFPAPPQVILQSTPVVDEPTPEERLRTLDRLKKDGLIEEHDYYWKRDEIMKEL